MPRYLDAVLRYVGLVSVGEFNRLDRKYSKRPYSPELAYRLTFLSRITYDPIDQIKNWSCSRCKLFPLTEVQVIYKEELNVLSYVGYCPDKDQIVVAFRGTLRDSLKNIVMDLYMAQQDWNYNGCKGCKVYKGFLLSLETVREDVQKKLTEIWQRHPNAKLMVTGHSLGGGMAAMFATYISQTYPNQIIIYTQGQPRLGNETFAKLMDSRFPTYFRLTHDNDIIPRIPIVNYFHAGMQVYFEDGMNQYTICYAHSKCSERQKNWREWEEHHYRDQYVMMKDPLQLGGPTQIQDFRGNSPAAKQSYDQVQKTLQELLTKYSSGSTVPQVNIASDQKTASI